MSIVLRQGGVLVTPVLAAACAAVQAKLNENTATAAIKILRVRIRFLPNVRDAQSLDQRGMLVAVPLLCSAKGRYRTFTAYSMIASARPINDSGTVMPSALAVLSLMISLNFLECPTDKSLAVITKKGSP